MQAFPVDSQHKVPAHTGFDPTVYAGFTEVFELMRDSNKPAVGHNLSFDLTFSLAAFAQQLPHSWLAYKQLVRRWLPAGVWDTKYLARQLQVLGSLASLLLCTVQPEQECL